jgi:dehydrogenase/reductase SDR family protein 12
MYNKRLELSDLQSTKGAFNGTLAYAQTKRQQVELTETWAKMHRGIKFFSMHPGWAETPGVQTSLPTFHNYMQGKLRTPEQGADTIVWAAIADEAVSNIRSGAFLFDRKEVSQHLPLSQTQAKPGDVEILMQKCDELIKDALSNDKK